MDNDICEKLKQARKAKGLTQQQVADLLHIHRSTYTKIETGHTELSLAVFAKLMRLLDIDPAWLLHEL